MSQPALRIVKPEEDEIAAAVQALLRKHFDGVWRLLRRLGLPRADADNAVQQVFVIAYRRFAGIQAGSERAFLFREPAALARDRGMSDPERLSRSPESSLAARLLRAAAEEKPSTAVLRRTAAAVSAVAVAASKGTGSLVPVLGVKHAASASSVAAPSATVAGTSASIGATLGIAAVAKWLAIGALGGAAALSSVQVLIAEQGTKHARAIPAAATNSRARKASPESTAAAPTAPMLAAAADPKEPERPSTVAAPRPQFPEPSLAGPPNPEAPVLTNSAFFAQEVRFVDQGRGALQRGAFSKAIEQLAPYESLFPRPQLLTEVLFLRMEAFSRLGNVERARPLASRVLTLGVVGPQAEQAREVLRR
jgi:RNA polymerase sigma-70 factor (ECF subfamily)